MAPVGSDRFARAQSDDSLDANDGVGSNCWFGLLCTMRQGSLTRHRRVRATPARIKYPPTIRLLKRRTGLHRSSSVELDPAAVTISPSTCIVPGMVCMVAQRRYEAVPARAVVTPMVRGGQSSLPPRCAICSRSQPRSISSKFAPSPPAIRSTSRRASGAAAVASVPLGAALAVTVARPRCPASFRRCCRRADSVLVAARGGQVADPATGQWTGRW